MRLAFPWGVRSMADSDIPDKFVPALRWVFINLSWILPLVAIERSVDGHQFQAAILAALFAVSLAIAVKWKAFLSIFGRLRTPFLKGVVRSPTLQAGLYLGEVRITFDRLETDRHAEVSMRIFNGTGRVIEFQSLSGQMTFGMPNSADPAVTGTLPPPSMRSDTQRTMPPWAEWNVRLSQQVPAPEADKILALLRDNTPINFNFNTLTLSVREEGKKGVPENMQLWAGIQYRRDVGFSRIMSGVINTKIGGRSSLS